VILSDSIEEAAMLAVKLTFKVSAALYDKSVNVATPFTVLADNVPCNVDIPELPRAAVMVVLLSLVITFPYASLTATFGC